MHDTTIPRHGRPRGRVYTTTHGHFVDDGNAVVLVDRHGSKYPLEQVSIQQGWWGSSDEGVARLPRPRRVSSSGETIVEGDRVRIDFLDGNPRCPIVSGGFRATSAGDFLPYNYASPQGGDRNRVAGRSRVLRDDGAEVGTVQWEVGAGGEPRVTVSLGRSSERLRTYVDLDGESGAIQAGTRDGTVLRLDEHSVTVSTSGGSGIVIDSAAGKVQVFHLGQVVEITDGSVKIVTDLLQMQAGRIELSDGVGLPSHPYLLLEDFLSDLELALNDVVTGLAAVPYTATVLTNFAGGLGVKYRSTTTKGA